MGQQTNNKSGNITKEQLATILNKYFTPTTPTAIPDEISNETDITLTTKDDKYTIMLSEIFKGKFSTQNNVVTLGEKYEDSWIGKTFTYTAGPEGNKESEWIIIGQDLETKDVIVTSKNPVSKTYENNQGITEWWNWEKILKQQCEDYTGKIGSKNIEPKEVRNITLKDINNAVGFTPPDTPFDEFTFGETNNFSEKKVNYYFPKEVNGTIIFTKPSNTEIWKHENNAYYYRNDNGTYKYASGKNGNIESDLPTSNIKKSENMKYVFANNNPYWVASHSILLDSRGAVFDAALVKDGYVRSYYYYLAYSTSLGGDVYGPSDSLRLRPCIVLSSDVQYNDVKNCIGTNYATYN